jgi:hypothetical protein
MSNEKFNIAFNKFFELKNQYDNKFSKFKQNLHKKKDMSITEKVIAVEDFLNSRKCIKCKNIGGTNFEITKSGLKALCNCDNPCELDIDIVFGDDIKYKDDLYESMEKDIFAMKQNITKDKLKLLFDLEKEDVVVRSFENKKKELITKIKEFNQIKNIFDSQDKITIDHKIDELINLDNFEEKKDENETPTVKRNVLIKSYNKKLNEHISEYNNRIERYKKENDENILEKAMEDYIKIIMPLKEKIRKTKYSSIYIEETRYDKFTTIYHIKNNKKDVLDKVTPRKNHKVVSNKY